MGTCHVATPTPDHREVRTQTLPSGRWWLRWEDETGESNTPQTEGRRRIQLTPRDEEQRPELVLPRGVIMETCAVLSKAPALHNTTSYLSL